MLSHLKTDLRHTVRFIVIGGKKGKAKVEIIIPTPVVFNPAASEYSEKNNKY